MRHPDCQQFMDVISSRLGDQYKTTLEAKIKASLKQALQDDIIYLTLYGTMYTPVVMGTLVKEMGLENDD